MKKSIISFFIAIFITTFLFIPNINAKTLKKLRE